MINLETDLGTLWLVATISEGECININGLHNDSSDMQSLICVLTHEIEDVWETISLVHQIVSGIDGRVILSKSNFEQYDRIF